MIVYDEEWKGYFKSVFLASAICIISYIVLISNGLTNTYDGMWQGSYYTGYPWVISIGRWFWQIIGKARLDMSPEPFTTIVSIILSAAGSCLVVKWFGIKDNWKKYVIILLSVINTSVCVSLSYRYMSPTFAVSYLLSVIAVYSIHEEQTVWRMIVSVICLTLSLGCYQANLGCSCLLVLLNIMWMLQKDSEVRKPLRFVLVSAICVALSCILYKVLWDIVLNITGIVPASNRGANSISVFGIMSALPRTIPNTFKVLWDYYFTTVIKHDAYQEYLIYKILLSISIVLFTVVGGGYCSQRRKRGIWYFM